MLRERVSLRLAFIKQHSGEWPVSVMCDVLQVDRSYYYEYVEKINTRPTTENTKLEQALITLFNRHRGNYGSRRLTKALQDLGFIVGRYKVRS